MRLVHSDNRRVPALRLEGFNGSVNLLTLGDIAGRAIGGGTPSTTNPSFWKGSLPWIQSSDLDNQDPFKVNIRKRISENAVTASAASIVPGNSLAIVTRVGVGKVAYMDDDYATSQDFLNLSDLHGDARYLAYAVKRRLTRSAESAQGTSIKGITKPEVLSLPVGVPSVEEQHVVSVLLLSIDRIINATEGRMKSLTSLKKTMLVKMFPQGTASTPEVRFEGFEDDWESSEFGNIFTHLPTNTLSRGDLTPSGDGVLNVHYGDVLVKFGNVLDVSGGGVPAISNVDAVKRLSPASFLRDGDVVVADTAEDDSVGKVTEISGTGSRQIVSGLHTYACRPLIDFAPGFLGQTLNSHHFHTQVVLKSQGSKVTSINKPALSTTEVRYPSLPEQQAIGSYFRSLDALIDAEQKKLATLRNLKSALLTQMFV